MNINEQVALNNINNTKAKYEDEADALMFLDILELGVENIVWADYDIKTQESVGKLIKGMLKDE